MKLEDLKKKIRDLGPQIAVAKRDILDLQEQEHMIYKGLTTQLEGLDPKIEEFFYEYMFNQTGAATFEEYLHDYRQL